MTEPWRSMEEYARMSEMAEHGEFTVVPGSGWVSEEYLQSKQGPRRDETYDAEGRSL